MIYDIESEGRPAKPSSPLSLLRQYTFPLVAKFKFGVSWLLGKRGNHFPWKETWYKPCISEDEEYKNRIIMFHIAEMFTVDSDNLSSP
ncbi:hypothetical protein J6590_087616 [Homalodisca vitripennis]|nr:hypothetical protein J6590_087616 [Homalodisca vitripennis]